MKIKRALKPRFARYPVFGFQPAIRNLKSKIFVHLTNGEETCREV